MRGGHGVVVKDLAIGGFAALGSGIPGGEALFGLNGAVSGDEVDVVKSGAAWRYGGDGDARRRTGLRGLRRKWTLGLGGSGLGNRGRERLVVMGAAGDGKAHQKRENEN
jgi:hypothetical protein